MFDSVCMYGTISVVFFTFLFRACYQFFLIAILANVSFNDQCTFVVGCNRCNGKSHYRHSVLASSTPTRPTHHADNCQCQWRPIFSWLDFTPLLEVVVETVSGPVALLVALWGMTTDRMLQLMNTRAQADGTAMATRSGRY